MNVDRLARPFVTLPYLMHFRRSRLTLEEHGNIMLNKYREMNNASSITNNADINYSTKKICFKSTPKTIWTWHIHWTYLTKNWKIMSAKIASVAKNVQAYQRHEWQRMLLWASHQPVNTVRPDRTQKTRKCNQKNDIRKAWKCTNKHKLEREIRRRGYVSFLFLVLFLSQSETEMSN